MGQNGDIEDAFSLNIGCVRMTEEFIYSDPITPAELKQIADHVTAQIQGRLDEVSMDGRSMVGVGGTLRTLFGIRQGCNSNEEHHNIMLRDELNSMIAIQHYRESRDFKEIPDAVEPAPAVCGATRGETTAPRVDRTKMTRMTFSPAPFAAVPAVRAEP